MQEPDRTSAHAVVDEWIALLCLRPPADSAGRDFILGWSLCMCAVIRVHDGLNLLKLKELLVIDHLNVGVVAFPTSLVAFINFHVVFFNNGDLLHCKLYSSYFYNVSLLELILQLLIVVLQTAHHQVHVLVQLLGH